MEKESSPVSLTAHAEFVDLILDVSNHTSPGLAAREILITINKCGYGRTSSVNIDFIGSPPKCPITFTQLDRHLTDISINGRKPRGRKLDKLRSAAELLLKEPKVKKAYDANHHGHCTPITIMLPPLQEKPKRPKIRQFAIDTTEPGSKRKAKLSSTGEKRKIKIDCDCGESYTLHLTDAEREAMGFEETCRECDAPNYI